MPTVPLTQARNEIMKLEAERRALPLMIIDLFGTLFAANGYIGKYKWSNYGGAHYFIFEGNGQQNKEYRIEIELYWDVIHFTIYRSLTRREKITDLLGFIGGSVFFLAWVALLVASFAGDGSMADLSTGGSGNSKSKKNPRSFRLVGNVPDICPGAVLNNQFNYATFQLVLQQHHDFFVQHLLPCIRGENWMEWRKVRR